MSKIYTKTGDKGETSYLGGRIAKDSDLIRTIGDIDELNAVIGICVSLKPAFASQLLQIQSELFSIGAIFADYTDKLKINYAVDEWVTRLESEIDARDADLEPLQNFILPGGTNLTAYLQLARSVCRRVERQVIVFNKSADVTKTLAAQKYFNRLSDWMFTYSRYANKLANIPDTKWVG